MSQPMASLTACLMTSNLKEAAKGVAASLSVAASAGGGYGPASASTEIEVEDRASRDLHVKFGTRNVDLEAAQARIVDSCNDDFRKTRGLPALSHVHDSGKSISSQGRWPEASTTNPSQNSRLNTDYTVFPGPACNHSQVCDWPTVCSVSHKDAQGEPRCVRVWKQRADAPVDAWIDGEPCGESTATVCPPPGICGLERARCLIPSVRGIF